MGGTTMPPGTEEDGLAHGADDAARRWSGGRNDAGGDPTGDPIASNTHTRCIVLY